MTIILLLLLVIAIMAVAAAYRINQCRKLLVLLIEQKVGRPIDAITNIELPELKVHDRSDENEHFIALQRLKELGDK